MATTIVKNRMKQAQPVMVRGADGRSRTRILLPGASIEIDSSAVTGDLQRRRDRGTVLLTEKTE